MLYRNTLSDVGYEIVLGEAGRVSGQVTFAGEPGAKQEIEAFYQDDAALGTWSVQTDDSGFYSLDGLPEGNVSV